MTNKLAEFIKQIINSPIVLPLGLSLGITLVCMILVIYLFLFGLINMFISLGYSNPLNDEYMPYKFCKDSLFVRTPYFYGIVFLIAVAAWVVSIWGLVMMSKKEGVSGQDKLLMVGVFIYTLWLSISSFAILAGSRTKIKPMSDSIRSFNNFVYKNIYKNTRFLTNLRNPTKNGLLIKERIQQAISTYCNDKLNVKNAETIGQVLFTVNYYYNLHKIGLDNPNLDKATQMLSPVKLLVVLSKTTKNAPLSFSPANYIYANGMFMDDYTNLWWDMIPRKCLDEIVVGTSKNPALVAKLNEKVTRNTIRAFVLTNTSSQISQLNNYANTIKTKDVLGIFFLISLLFIGVYWLPVIVLALLKPETRAGFFNFLGSLFGVEAPVAPGVSTGTQEAGEAEQLLGNVKTEVAEIKGLGGQRGGGEKLFDEAMGLLCEARKDVIRLRNLEKPDQPIPVDGKCTEDILKSEEIVEPGDIKVKLEPEAVPQPPVVESPAAAEIQAPVATEPPVEAPVATEPPVPIQVVQAPVPPVEAPKEHSAIVKGILTTAINKFLETDAGKKILNQVKSEIVQGKGIVKEELHQQINKLIVEQPEIGVPLKIAQEVIPLDKIIDQIADFAINKVEQEATQQGGKGRRTYQRKQNRSRN
jgi:hypothetical protein